MNVSKKVDRLRQWGKEKMGSEVRTNTTEDFKALETEMQLRHEGMERLQKSMNVYIKALSKKADAEEKGKYTPMAYLGSTMTKHGEEFEDGAKLGECLIVFGQTHEKMARMQDTYTTAASSSWLDSVERSLAQMKDYQNARKKLEARRLAYDASMAKMQKAKKEDFRSEEDLRSQKAKYEESSEDVYYRMQDIVESEADSVVDLYSFLEAEYNYHDRCREILLQLKRNWPVQPELNVNGSRRGPRSRSSTLNNTNASLDDYPLSQPNPPFRNVSRASSGSSSPIHELGYQTSSQESEIPLRGTTLRSQISVIPASRPQILHAATESITTGGTSRFRSVKRPALAPEDVFCDPIDDRRNSPAKDENRNASIRSRSPAMPYENNASSTSREAPDIQVKSYSYDDRSRKGPPPPPPPSRSTKPPPPPPPMKRSALSAPIVPHV